MTQRIGYLDAMRGFTMFLVVYNHVLQYSFEGGAIWSINDVFLTFRMPLFFFLSGFLMYKKNLFREAGALTGFLRKKGIVQLLPTLIFSLTYALLFSIPYSSLLLDKAKCGYWFTYTLFFFFVIYAFGDYLIGKIIKGTPKIFLGIFLATLIYSFAKFSLSSSCPWLEHPITGVLGFANFQFFLFFFFGALVRTFFGKIECLLETNSVVTGIIMGFVLFQIILQAPICQQWIIGSTSYSIYSLLRSLSGFFGIATVFVFFRKNEYALSKSRIGHFFQYIGKRTLDIYLIHLILVRTDIKFIGIFLAKHSSIISELVLGGTVTLIIIGLCLLISQFVRCSDTLAKYLFGKIIRKT